MVPGLGPRLDTRHCLLVLTVLLTCIISLQHRSGHVSCHQSWRPPWPADNVVTSEHHHHSEHDHSDHVSYNTSVSRVQYGVGRAPVVSGVTGGDDTRHSRSAPLHSTQCLVSLQPDISNLQQTAEEICRCEDTWRRVHLTLHHPSHVFRSQCWAHSATCLPPVLTPSQMAAIMSEDRDTCLVHVEATLSRILTSNLAMEDSLAVLLSGHRMVECDHNAHCQSCMVSRVQFLFISTALQYAEVST